MSEPTVTCPKCQSEIPLSKTLAEPLVAAERARFEAEAKALRHKLEHREEELLAELTKKFAEEKKKLIAKAQQDALRESAENLDSLEKELEVEREKVKRANAKELELLRKATELEDAKRDLELQKQRELNEERGKIREAAQKDEAERHRMKDAEREKTISDLMTQIAELQRKEEQGSQQLQGEVQELNLESTLRTTFALDVVEPVPKGQHGGDCMQRVVGPGRGIVGGVLWESKRTKSWSDGWLAKLRDDQRAAKAELAILVTATLPKSIERFGMIDGIWVTDWASAMPLASALRQQLLELARARQATEGQQTKMELVYDYLCGPQFRQRVQGIAEAFITMRADLDTERRLFEKHWSKREKQLERMLKNTAGLYGDLQGIADQGLPEIEELEMKPLALMSDGVAG